MKASVNNKALEDPTMGKMFTKIGLFFMNLSNEQHRKI